MAEKRENRGGTKRERRKDNLKRRVLAEASEGENVFATRGSILARPSTRLMFIGPEALPTKLIFFFEYENHFHRDMLKPNENEKNF